MRSLFATVVRLHRAPLMITNRDTPSTKSIIAPLHHHKNDWQSIDLSPPGTLQLSN